MKYFLLVLFCFNVFAQDANLPVVLPEETPTKTESPVEKVIEEEKPVTKEVSETSELLRAESFGTLMIGYQFVTSWLPSKKTVSYTQNLNAEWAIEAEYAWAGLDVPSYIAIDLGGVKERRYTLQARRFVGNSFHFTFGAVYSEFEARLGNSIADQFGDELYGTIGAENLGVTGGMGNRWQWKNGFTLGIDWLRMNIPVIHTKIDDEMIKQFGNEGDQEDAKKVIRTFNRVPTFVLFGLNIGYTF